MDGMLEEMIRECRDLYVGALCEHTSLTEEQATAMFIKEEWNTNTLRKPLRVAKYRAVIINGVENVGQYESGMKY